MAGGSRNYAEMYSKYKQGVASGSDFEKYVDSKGDLKNAWTLIDAYNKGEDVDKKFAGKYPHPAGLSPSQQAEYWQKRGATSKAAFGRSHAAEDAALYSGTYQGATDYTKGSDAWKRLFGDRTGTRFDEWNKNKDKDKDKDKDNGGKPKVTYPWDNPENKTNVFHPMLVPDYEAPEAHSMFGAEYQPWSQASVDDGYVPENVWNYAPPQLTVGRPQWGANPMGPLSEQPWIDIENAKKAAAAKAAAATQFREGGGDHQFENDSAGVPWQNSFLAPLGYKLGWNYAGPGMTNISSKWQDMGDDEDDMIDAQMMADANMGNVQATIDEVMAAAGYETSEDDDYD